jgi:hypothetical protein
MTRNGGSMADPGSVSYLFNRKGVVIVPKGELTEDDVLGAVLDAGAEEVNDLGENFEVISEATDLVAVRTALVDAGIDYDSADASFLPSVSVPLDEDGAKKVFRLIEALEDSDDVQNVWANFDVSDEVMEAVGCACASGGPAEPDQHQPANHRRRHAQPGDQQRRQAVGPHQAEHEVLYQDLAGA